jgi:type VI secretion system protein ImpE
MEAKELFKAGDLNATIERLVADVKARPLDLSSRIFLFEALCFAADYARAERQLDAIASTSGDVNVEMGVLVYRTVLQAEKKRAAFFAGTQSAPRFFAEPPPYTALHMEALAKARANDPDRVETLLEESAALRQPVAGANGGAAFNDFHDADDILAPFFEVLLQGEYYWLPIAEVKELVIRPPVTLRDLLWLPVKISLHSAPLGEVFLPVQYFGSGKHENDLVRLGRMTDWKTIGAGTLVGIGQRTFLIDETECPVLELRQLAFTGPA